MVKKKVAQIGSFDVENFGDLLFPDVLKSHLADEFEVDLFSPVGGIKPFDKIVVYPISKLEEMIIDKHYDAIIIGGGDVIRTDSRIFIRNDTYGYSSEPSLELWAYPIMLARKHNICVLLNAVGVTNDFQKDEIPIIRELLENVDYLAVRDSEAQNALRKIGVFNSIVVPDTVLSIKNFLDEGVLKSKYDELLKKKIIPKINHYVVFQHNSTNVDDKEYYDNILKLIKRVALDHPVLLMPIGYVHDDDKILEKIYKEKIENVYFVNNKVKLFPDDILSILFNSYGYLGTSMHGAVVSAAFEKKIMILNSMNSKKLHGFSNIIGKSILNVNNSNNLLYVYENYFESQNTVLDLELIRRIDEHFHIMKKKINNRKNNSISLDCINFVKAFYKYKNEHELIGQYYIEEEGYLNREIFKYHKIADNVYSYTLKNKFNKFYLYPIVNDCCYIEKFCVDGISYPSFIDYYYDNCFVELNSEHNECIIEITLKSVEDREFYESVLTKKRLLQLENIYSDTLIAYKNLEKKYCDMLKK